MNPPSLGSLLNSSLILPSLSQYCIKSFISNVIISEVINVNNINNLTYNLTSLFIIYDSSIL